MADVAYGISEAVRRLRCFDPTFKGITLRIKRYTKKEIAKLIDCLLDHPDVVIYVNLIGIQLEEETGIKLARYLVVSSTIRTLAISRNQFSDPTYLAVAAALQVNTSLKCLYLNGNQGVIKDKNCIDAAFIDALILNPNRSIESKWYLYSGGQNDFPRLKAEAERLGHPNMQAMLAMQLV